MAETKFHPFRFRCRECGFRGKGLMSEKLIKDGKGRRLLLCYQCYSPNVVLGD